MELSAVPRVAVGAIFRTLDQEAVVLNVDTGSYYVLNETATAIWNLIDGKRTLANIVAGLCADYQITCDKAEQSLQCLMADLLRAHLVLLAPGIQGDPEA